jgi:hypothetical protein
MNRPPADPGTGRLARRRPPETFMPSRVPHPQLLAGVVALALLPAGCARSEAPPARHPVRGRVLFYGQPAAGVRLEFHAPGGETADRPGAVTAADGSFAVGTRACNDGAPAGEYAVTLHWPEVADGPDRLRGKYADPTTPRWRVTVQPGENTLPVIQLP